MLVSSPGRSLTPQFPLSLDSLGDVPGDTHNPNYVVDNDWCETRPPEPGTVSDIEFLAVRDRRALLDTASVVGLEFGTLRLTEHRSLGFSSNCLGGESGLCLVARWFHTAGPASSVL